MAWLLGEHGRRRDKWTGVKPCLGVKRDAFVIERALEEEVRERCEGVESKGNSRYDEKGEAHRSLRRVRLDSVLHSIPLLPVVITWNNGVSSKRQQPRYTHRTILKVFVSNT